jgi:hypothetical protein
VTKLHCCCNPGNALYGGFKDPSLHIDPCAGKADLPRIHEHCLGKRWYCRIEIGIFEYKDR